MSEAFIIAHKREIAMGRFEITYEWVGDPRWPVFLDPDFIPGGLSILPWPLTLVESGYPMDLKNMYMRADGRYRLWVMWTRFRYALRRHWEWFYTRLIMTAMVWGLAYVEPGAIPSWKDLGKKQPW